MDVTAVRQGLAAAAAAVTSLNCYAFVPDVIAEPCFYPGAVDINYDKAYQRGMDEFFIDCMLLVSRAEAQAGQEALDRYLAGSGAYSVKSAVEGTPGVAQTLGGACHDVHVINVRGYRQYQVGETSYYGAKLRTHIVGRGDA